MSISKYWREQGKTEADKKRGKTWEDDVGELRCNECCNKDYDDGEECYHGYYRPKCPYCLGSGVNASKKGEKEVMLTLLKDNLEVIEACIKDVQENPKKDIAMRYSLSTISGKTTDSQKLLGAVIRLMDEEAKEEGK